jgi:hypothetical protein
MHTPEEHWGRIVREMLNKYSDCVNSDKEIRADIGLPQSLERRDQRQNRDDRHHDQQLDQREPPFRVFIAVSPHTRFLLLPDFWPRSQSLLACDRENGGQVLLEDYRDDS